MTFTVTTIKKLAETNQIKTQAISLLKELRIICGINQRKFNFSVDKSNKHPVYFEFNYMSQIIDKFVEENKLEGFKK
tara:strand:- start:110 stop:340 length:231 start_codon:yes stop_codon:yes gene_type:complete